METHCVLLKMRMINSISTIRNSAFISYAVGLPWVLELFNTAAEPELPQFTDQRSLPSGHCFITRKDQLQCKTQQVGGPAREAFRLEDNSRTTRPQTTRSPDNSSPDKSSPDNSCPITNNTSTKFPALRNASAFLNISRLTMDV
jgi:hypothetical protein